MTAQKTLSEWLAYIQQQHPQSISMGLERVSVVAKSMGLGHPARHCIVVGGTNGKGSTVAFIEAIARAAGWKVGTYTSPHLMRYNERVRIDGREVDDALLVEAFSRVEVARRETELTFFEFGTLAALWLFSRAVLDLAILEVGLGGRLDAVNLVDADVAVITTVDIDHTEWLGSDREVIGKEKAGIIRSWKPVVLGELDPPSSVLRHAYLLGANAIRAGSDFFYEQINEKHWRWWDVSLCMELPLPALSAPIQLANAASAIAALRALPRTLPFEAWSDGVAKATIAGRLQAFQIGTIQVLLDVGHNPQAAQVLASALRTQPIQGNVTHAVYAALVDKDVLGVATALAEIVTHWHLAGLDCLRGQSAECLAGRLAEISVVPSSLSGSVTEALQQTLQTAAPGDRVLVFGSFHTVAEALLLLGSFDKSEALPVNV
ncbi:bifunctional tetrahydrofolate synthase/dihydrofolate synthase [Xylella fastidiosa subsp. multiplex]|uniref:Dihydrofolate synthase/folylpolyglutamate synthase n=1 Tax=Xylella fastidiosa subsp. multiplex TaxID=644357 RepID=A0A9Q4MIV1_XYLFS|nr:bifunctional tetrahydrofolate synthase/dihydrofolate synthase [Xylella fastidiosa]ERI60337.1 folylpolyglutamate synthase [Xylella fastidiosa subsp. multiplex Griffin-1]ACA11991.1 Dihydrofolate synthase [Xylella fastidiosa M12]KAJ4852750.1 bifunctional tetrahydrofolate synthase/dihydrofolate synthase [Xylella fastidiosa subsp. multiplex]MBE0268638.1 bifunctional tetrahydrofolate synthase/dihydrofolate synthase [Xylella fastidiosa subsp. multiplex]MBE0274954.1 bifunctional tetrahydrofolate sy